MIRLVSSLACLLLHLLGPSPAPAQAPPVKIGTILPDTGFLSVQGTDTTHGLELYLKKIGGRAGGRAIELVKEDTEAKPDLGLWPSRHSKAGWVPAALITAAIDGLKGDVNDRTQVRESLRAALPMKRPGVL